MLVPEIWISGSLQLVFLGWIPYSNSNDSIETTSYPCPPECMYACMYLFWAQEVAIFIFEQYIQLRDGHTYTLKVRAD